MTRLESRRRRGMNPSERKRAKRLGGNRSEERKQGEEEKSGNEIMLEG